jgi:long-subunit fatty acid transport protein
MYRYGLGFKYRRSDNLTLGAGLSFLWQGDTKVKPSGGAARGQVSGQYDNVNITFLSLYAQW